MCPKKAKNNFNQNKGVKNTSFRGIRVRPI